MKKGIIIIIFLAVLILSGVDFTFKDAFLYALIYLIGKTVIYYFESKKINWKQNMKDFAFFIFYTSIYHICHLILESIGFRPIKIFSNVTWWIGAIIGGLSVLYIVFVVPFKILTQKSKKINNET